METNILYQVYSFKYIIYNKYIITNTLQTFSVGYVIL